MWSSLRHAGVAALLLVALALLLSHAGPARADDDPREAAREHYAQGLKLAGQNGYQAALDEFIRAYAISPQFAVLYNIAQCYVALGHTAEAIEALSRYLREGGDRLPAGRRELVGSQIARLGAQLARPSRAAEGASELPQDAREHYLRGLELVGQNAYRPALEELNAAYAIRPEPGVLYSIGQCHVALGHVREGIEALSTYLREGQDRMPPGRHDLIEVQLALLESRMAELTIIADRPGARVTVDGREVGTTPLAEPVRLAAGTHTVAARFGAAPPASQQVTLVEAERRALRLAIPRTAAQVAGARAASAAAARAAAAAAAAAAAVGRDLGRLTGIPFDRQN